MRILVISDTHRKEENLKKVMETEEKFDLAIHLGDAEGKHELIRDIVGCPFHAVRGNCDSYGDLPLQKEIFLQGNRTLLTHGHRFHVNMYPEVLASEAATRGCRITMFGHTHRPYVGQYRGVWMINPGSLSEPRQANRKPSYIVLTITEEGEILPDLKYL